MVTLTDTATMQVGDVELKLRIVLQTMIGILLHQGIAQHKKVKVVGVDMEGVGDGLLFRTDSPVAQPNRDAMAVGNGVEPSTCPGVTFKRVGMHRVAGTGRQRTRIDNAHGPRGVTRVTRVAGHTSGVKVVERYLVVLRRRARGLELHLDRGR